jgi:uncharacterized membrane protein
MQKNEDINDVESQGLTTSRIEALHDGVFAIVMTLLVFQLKVPEVTSAVKLYAALQELWPFFLIYLVSFISLGIFWVGQHIQFHYIMHSDRILLWLNIVYLMWISLLPFSTALVGGYPMLQLPYLVFGFNLVVIGIMGYCHWHYATTHHRLTEHTISPELIRGVKTRLLLLPLVAVIAMILSSWKLQVSLGLYLLLPLYYIWPGKVDRFWSMPAVPHRDERAV